MKALYKFHWDCGRMGYVRGTFIEEKSEVEKAIGSRVYFGEILGKHSQIYGDLKKEDLEEITTDHDFISKFEELELESGYNPLDYIEE